RSDVLHGDGIVERALTAVGESDVDHEGDSLNRGSSSRRTPGSSSFAQASIESWVPACAGMMATKKAPRRLSGATWRFEASCRKFALTCRTLGLRLRAATSDLAVLIFPRPAVQFNPPGVPRKPFALSPSTISGRASLAKRAK